MMRVSLLLLYSVLVCFIVFSSVSPAHAGTLSMHVAVGDWVSRHTTSPPAAFAIGFLSHAALDAIVKEHVIDWQNPRTLRKHLPYIVIDIALTGWVVSRINKDADPDSRARRWAGVIGAVVPDLIDGLYSLVCPSCWQKGELLMPWHRADSKMMSERQTVAWAIAIVALSL